MILLFNSLFSVAKDNTMKHEMDYGIPVFYAAHRFTN